MESRTKAEAEGGRWQRLRALFDELVEFAPAERTRALELVSGVDAELRAELLALLEAAERPDSFLVSAPGLGEPGAAPLAPFRLGAAFPAGRAGRVYRAHAQDGRELALRSIPIAFDDLATLQRLRGAARGLTSLAHAGLVRVLEMGLGARLEDPALPAIYFASELVAQSWTLEEYARREQLDARDRLALFRTACSAVETAHAHGIAHGNLSAANLRVDARGGLCVLDLGVAAVCGMGSPDSGALEDVRALGERLAALFEGSAGDAPTLDAVRAIARHAADPNRRRRPASVAQLLAALPGA